jgi:hypothetical protein
VECGQEVFPPFAASVAVPSVLVMASPMQMVMVKSGPSVLNYAPGCARLI